MVGPVGVAIGRTTLENLINRIADPLFGIFATKPSDRADTIP